VLEEAAYALMGLDAERSRERHLAALAIAEEVGDVRLQVRILARLALLQSNQLDLAGAADAAQRALALATAVGEDAMQGLAIDAQKLIALKLGDLDRLEQLAAALEEVERRDGNLWYLQWTLLEAAFVPLARARFELAARRLDEALAVSERLGNSLAAPLIHDGMCWLERSRGRYERGLAQGRRATELS